MVFGRICYYFAAVVERPRVPASRIPHAVHIPRHEFSEEPFTRRKLDDLEKSRLPKRDFAQDLSA